MFLKKKMPGAVLDCLILCSSLQDSRELLSLIYSQSEQLPEINVTSFRGTVWKFSDPHNKITSEILEEGEF